MQGKRYLEVVMNYCLGGYAILVWSYLFLIIMNIPFICPIAKRATVSLINVFKIYFCHIMLLRVSVFFNFYSLTTISVSKFLSPNPNCKKLCFLNLNIHVINYAKPHSITCTHLLTHILYSQ